MTESNDKGKIPYLPRSYGFSCKNCARADGRDAPDVSIGADLDAASWGEGPDADDGEIGDADEANGVATDLTDELMALEAEEPERPFADSGHWKAVSPPSDRRIAKIRVTIVGIRFNYAGKIYHFDSDDLELAVGDRVVVKTEKGLGLGRTAVAPRPMDIEPALLEGLRKVLRKAIREDFEQQERCVRKEQIAHAYCEARIAALNLAMKLVGVECFFDCSKYVFYFTAEGRVDFRELVKQLVQRFPVRIEMRQIGVRHEAKMIGGLASCGQELCCARFLNDFRPVSVKMAKTQNLSLNPGKISGVCGRLMCCLAYEHEIYEAFRKGVPKVGKTVMTPKGPGVIIKLNPLTETVQVRLDESVVVEIPRKDLL
jgi:cell fate regulator YaaT (PSP1 superfamily)